MKKFIVLLILFSNFILANGTPIMLKTFSSNEEINISDIAQYSAKFISQNQEMRDEAFEIILFNSDEPSSLKQNKFHKTNWIMLEFDANLSSGTYWVEHTNFEFTEHTFLAHQAVEKFSLFGRKIFSFSYDKTRDKQRFFLKVLPSLSHVVPVAKLHTAESFSRWSADYGLQILLSFFIFGLIFMTAVYNGALYLYNREKSFLYYMLMQLFMVIILFYQTDLLQIYVMGNAEDEEIAIFFYFVIVECVMVLMLLFVRSFLETKKYLPFQEKILRYITIFSIIDLVIFFFPIMLIFNLYSFFMLYFLWVAWLRLRQGYKPALFFLIGWFGFMLGVFFSDFTDEDYYLDPLIIGSIIEALFLAIAISYKMHEIKEEQEKQQGLLVHQSKLASMGEMLGNIAHQWRQPLSRLGYILMNIEAKDREKHHEQKLEEASTQLEFMSQTIDDFRNFYAPNKTKELFSLALESQRVIEFMSFEKIEVILNIVEDTEILNYKNEYKQVLLNLLSNAKDILTQRRITSPTIIIEIKNKSVSISDNAGGIHLKNIEQIFEPYFSTKEQGMGIGLYMSKMIIERNMGGKLEVDSSLGGAVFRVIF